MLGIDEILLTNAVNCGRYYNWGKLLLREAEVKIDNYALILYRLAATKFGFSIVSARTKWLKALEYKYKSL
jgi:hypothetical protein